MALSVIVPTYNERENIGPLLERIDATLDSEYEVVVVDDDSPDGTWEVAREHADEYPVRVVRRREESGLATAVVRGIEEATYDVLVVMDADLQHPPETIPDLLAALEDGADIAVGSRLVEGGGMPDFGPHRRLISYGANLVARILLREVRGVRDLQSGFFAFRRSVVWGADLAPRGYKILIEVLVMGEYDTVTEVGFEFRERHGGRSKFTLAIVLQYLQHLVSLWMRRRK